MNKHETLHTLLLGAFDNQDKLNQRVNPDWVNAGYPWYRAIWVEVAEAIQPLNWIWWRAGTFGKDTSQQQKDDLHIELCDILHFGMSLDIVRNRNPAEVHPTHGNDFSARLYQQMFNETRQTKPEFYEDIEKVAQTAIENQQFDIEHFARACSAVGLSLEMLLVLYYTKSTLNHFRQNNGYNLKKGEPGAYIKQWPDTYGTQTMEFKTVPTVEDNVILHRMLKTLVARNPIDEVIAGIADGSFKDGLTRQLQLYYDRQVLKK